MTSMSGDEGSFGDRWREMREEVERRHPEVAWVRAEYSGWLVGFLQVDPASGTA